MTRDTSAPALLSADEALSLVLNQAQVARGPRQVALPLSACLGRVLAASVCSPTAVPYFDNAQMDGFTVCAASTRGASPEAPVRLQVRGAWAAGDVVPPCEPDAAYEITTGAMMPETAFDAVIKVEDVRREQIDGESYIWLEQEVRPGDNVRYRGADFAPGQELEQSGALVSPALIMACAGLGIDRLTVYEPLRIALLATGKELQRYSDTELREGSIRDASGPYLEAILQNPLYELILHKLIPDEPELFSRELKLCLEMQADIVMSTGAVSMGRHDFVREVLEQTGARILFHKVAMRPGKPLLFAQWEQGPVLFGLPGNPISTLIGWRFFTEPYARALLDRSREEPQWARLEAPCVKPQGLTCYSKALVRQKGSEQFIQILEGQGSHMMSPLLRANAWACLPEQASELAEGEVIAWYPL